MAKVNQQKPKESDEPVAIEYKGNELVTAEQQQGYADILKEMKEDPMLGKMMLAPEWSKINAIISYRILRELEKR